MCCYRCMCSIWGRGTFDLSQACMLPQEFNNGGRVQRWGRVPSMSAVFSNRLQNRKKNASAQGSLKFRDVSNSFWECTRERKPVLRNLVTYLGHDLLNSCFSSPILHEGGRLFPQKLLLTISKLIFSQYKLVAWLECCGALISYQSLCNQSVYQAYSNNLLYQFSTT